MVNDKDDDAGRSAQGRYSLASREFIYRLDSWDTRYPRSKESIQPVRILRYAGHSNPDRVSSLLVRSQPPVRAAQVPSGKGMNQEAKATRRKARGTHNPVDTATNGGGDTDAERRLTWL
jgi:hypothetical protein